MANQVIVSNTGNVQVQISRVAVGTLSNVPTANYANFAGNVTGNDQPNITNVGTLGNLVVSNLITTQDLTVLGNFAVGNLIANSANYANYAGNLINGSSNVDIPTSNGNVSITSNGTKTWTFDTVGNTTLPGNMLISGNIIPSSNITYDLGSNTNRFRDLYLANTTIYLGEQQISANANNVTFTGVITGNGSGLTGVNLVSSANYSNFSGNLVVTGNEGNISVKTSNTGIYSYVKNGNSYTVQSQSKSNWEVYTQDDDTGPNPTYAWINAILNDGAPSIFMETMPLSTGIPQRLTFDSTGNLTLPGNTFSVNYANGEQVPLYGNSNVISLLGNFEQNPIGNIGSISFIDSDDSRGIGYTPITPGAGALTINYGEGTSLGLDTTGISVTTPGGTWNFGNTGNLTLPANTFAINYANGTQVPLDSIQSSISNGTSNVDIATSNGNVTVTSAGNTTLTITGTGANITGTLSASGDIAGANLTAGGDLSVTGNITSVSGVFTGNGAGLTNINASNITDAYGNSNVATFLASYGSNTITTTGNITVGNLLVASRGAIGVAPQKEIHVARNGSDGDGNGSITNPYRTITYALTQASSGTVIVVHPGGYTEDVTVNNLSGVSITAAQPGAASPQTCVITGNLVVSGTSGSVLLHSVGVVGNITHNSTGSFYVTSIQMGTAGNTTTFNKTGTGYLEVFNGNWSGGTPAVNVTGAGLATFNGVQLTNLTVSNASASVILRNVPSAINTTLTSGTLTVISSTMIGNSNTAPAITTVAGALNIQNSILLRANNTAGIMTVGASTAYLYDDIFFDRANSTLSGIPISGTAFAPPAEFQAINADRLSVTGNITATGNITGGNITGANLVSANFFTGTLTTAAQPNITSTGTLTSLSVSGNANIGNIGTGIITATGNITGDNLITGGIVSATGNITANYFIGNGSQLTGITATAGTSIVNGTSNVSVVLDGNVTTTVAGNTTMTITGNGANIAGTLSATGNITGNYFIGNGSQLTGITASAGNSIVNGNSNVSIATANSNITITSNGIHTWNFDDAGNLTLPANSFNVNYANGTQVSLGGGGSSISNGTSNVDIATSGGNVSISSDGTVWNFDATGNLTFPNGTVISPLDFNDTELVTPAGGDLYIRTKILPTTLPLTISLSGADIEEVNRNYSLDSTNPPTYYPSDYDPLVDPLIVYDTNLTTWYVYVVAGGAFPYYNAGSSFAPETQWLVTGGQGGTVAPTGVYTYDNDFTETWIFDGQGNLTLPGNTFSVNYANGTQVSLAGDIKSTISNGNSNVNIATANSNVSITSNGTHIWNFDDTGNLTSPGNITATGNIFAPAIVQNASTYDTRVSLSSAAGIVEITSNGNSTQFGPSGTVTLGGASQIIGGTFGGSGITVAGTQTDIFQNRGGNVTVQVGTSGSISDTWTFAQTGNLIVPKNIHSLNNASIELAAFDNGSPVTAALIVYDVANESVITGVTLFPDEVRLQAGTRSWSFDDTGNLTLPLNTFTVNYANGDPVSLAGDIKSTIVNGNSNVNIATANSNVSITSNGTHTWDFGTNGNLTIPGSIHGQNNTSIELAAFDPGSLTTTAALVVYDAPNESILTGVTLFADEARIQSGPRAWSFDDTGNLTLPLNTFTVNYANGTQVDISNVANSNYAAYAGNVTISDQPNITSVGNLPYLQVSNSSNADGVIRQTSSGNIVFSTGTPNLATYQLTTQYHPNASTSYPADRYVRSRGNVTTPATAVSGDRILGRTGYLYNGTTNVSSVSETWTGVGTVTTGSSAAWSGGQWNITTGNPQGDTSNSTALSSQNSLVFNSSGTLTITPGTAPNTSLGQSSSSISVTNYGRDTTNLQQVGGLNFQRARGNRDSVQNIQAGDQIGRSLFIGYSNGAYQISNVAQIRSQVSSSYTDNDVIIPQDIVIQAISNVAGTATLATTTFYGNGQTNLPGVLSATGNITGANIIVGTGSNTITLNGTTGFITYNKSFGSFTSNATQTNSNVGNAVYMTLNNDEGSNGVSIVSSSQITVARPGRYNIQFSAQMEKTDAGTDAVEIWLTKNGSSVANSATRLQIQGTNEKDVAAWNWVDNATTANTYYQIAWASTDANMQLVAIGSGSTLSGVAVPSLIVTVVPVGA